MMTILALGRLLDASMMTMSGTIVDGVPELGGVRRPGVRVPELGKDAALAALVKVTRKIGLFRRR